MARAKRPAGRIWEVVERHRRQLLRRERAAANRIVSAYGEAWRALQADAEELARRMQALREQAESTYTHEAALSALAQIRREIEVRAGQLADVISDTVRSQQEEFLRYAEWYASEAALAVAPPETAAAIQANWRRLPYEAFEDLVGFLANGSPLRDLLAQMGRETGQAIERVLLSGVALGWNPRRMAREVRQQVAVSLRRALTICRTETLRAHREATRRTYMANKGIVRGWMWAAAHSIRTCPACLATDGKVFPLDERMDDHPNGRCAMVPIVEGSELPARETGADWFARQDPATQDKILGPVGGHAYRAGRLELEDWVGQKHSPDWGTTRYARSLRQILGPEEALKWWKEAWEKGAESRKVRRDARERDH